MVKIDIDEIKPDLDNIYTDLLMLQDKSWQPDKESIEASLNTIRNLASTLFVELKDTRDG